MIKHKKSIFLLGGIILLFVVFVGGKEKRDSPKEINTAPQAIETRNASTLRDLGVKKGKKMGAAMNDFMISGDPMYAQTAAREYSSITVENHMKWEYIHPSLDSYDYTHPDRVAGFAKTHGMVMRGHPLVHTGQLPAWLTTGVYTGEQLDAIMKDHIVNVMGHFKTNYPGIVTSWDVVNEAVDEAGLIKQDVIWGNIGTSKDAYVAKAFQYAREAYPEAKLFYNDNGIETLGPKSDAVYNLIKNWKAEGVSIDGIGFQSHILKVENDSLAPDFTRDLSTLEANMKRYIDLGLEVHITEFDVLIKTKDGIGETELSEQAAIYKKFMSACMKFAKCTSFTTWGITDKYNWLSHLDGNVGAPLPFDLNFAKKPAYHALSEALLGR